MKKLLVGCAVAVAVVALIASATAEPLYFIVKTADHTYNSAGNWYRPGPNNTFTAANKVPVPDDDAVIYAGNGNTCDATGVTAPLKSLTIRTGNSLTGGDFDLGALTFAPSGGPGTIGVFGTHFSIRSSGALNFNASGVGINDSQIILNGGSFATVASGAGPGFSGTTIFNEGSFVIQAGASVFFLSKANRFDNIGDIRGNGGTTHITSEFHNLTLNNSGTIRADSGTLFIDGEIIWAADDGTGSFYPFTKDAVVEFTGGFVVPPNKTYYFKGPGTVMTLGSVTVNGTLEVGVPASGPTGSHILADSAPAEPGNMVTVGNSTVGGGGVLNINKMSEFDVRGATVVGLGNGPGFLAFNTKEDGKTRISGPTNNGTDFESSGRAIWTIDGTVTTNVRQLQLTSTKITVGPVGTFNCEAPMEIGDDGSFESAMQVLGKMIARRGLGENPRPGIAIPFDLGPNGKFYLAGQGGPFQFAPYNALHSEDTFAGGLGRDESEILAPYIELLNGVFNVEPGVNFNDTRVAVSGNAVLNFNAVTAAINDFELDAGATLKGTGDLTILTKFLLNGGTVEGGDPLSTGLRVTLGPNCTSTVSTANDKIFNGGSFINNGVVNWANPGLLKFSNTVVLTNNGSFIFGADCTINSDPSSSFLNNGIFISTPPSGSSTSIGVPFSNTGGTVKINGSTTIFAAYAQSAGSTTFVDGVVNSPDTMNFTGGTLDGNGAINANVVNDGCTFDPNALPVMTNVKEERASDAGATVAASTSPRRLTINGNYTQTSKGTFAVDIAGLATAGTDYSLLSVSGTAMLGGALRVRDVNGFKPSPTDTVVPLTAGSISGKFDSTNAQVNYGPTSLTVAALPLPAA
ncbi:MAG: hypothetical protein ACJ8JD_00055, partial [Chthoniobacterales bacterium]